MQRRPCSGCAPLLGALAVASQTDVVPEVQLTAFAVLSPFVLVAGQDVAEVLQLLNGLVVGGLGGFFARLQAEPLTPLLLVDGAKTAVAACAS